MVRTINLGDSEVEARYQIQDTDPAGGDLVLARDLDNGGLALLEWNATAGEWVFGGPVNLDGNDLTTTGAVSAGTLEADSAAITNTASAGTLDADSATITNTASAGTLDATDSLGNATYPTLADVPTTLPAGTQVYVQDEQAIYVEDGL